MSLIPFVVIIIAFWFLLIRPQQKRARQAREMQSALGVGDKVMLTSGIYGEVADVTDDHVLVGIADGVEVRVVRNAIGRVLPDEAAIGGEDAAQSADDDADGAAGADTNVDLSKPAAETSDAAAEPGAEPYAQPYAQPSDDSFAGSTDTTPSSETPEETLARLRKQGENQ